MVPLACSRPGSSRRPTSSRSSCTPRSARCCSCSSLQLQVVAGFSPLAAGISLLPMTLIMLVLSARSGALAARIGPRLQMTVGPLIAAVGMLLHAADRPGCLVRRPTCCRRSLVFGLGMTTTVAPLTATVLAAAPAEHAGVASGREQRRRPHRRAARGRGAAADRRADRRRLPRPGRVRRRLPHGGLDRRRDAASPVGYCPRSASATDPKAGKRQDTEHCYSCPVEGPHLETVQPARMQRTR